MNAKAGLVMEGGAMRGMFTAGVLDVFMENGIEFPAAVGVSAGAVFGCNLKSRQIGRAIRYNKRFCRDKRYCSFHSLRKTGDIFGADFCYRELPEELDIFDKEAFEQNPMDFYVVATDIHTGEPVYKKLDKVDESCYLWMRASASMPLMARPVEIDGMSLLDGGVSDSIPLKFMRELGYEKNIVILTRPRDYMKKQENRLMLKAVERKYPVIAEKSAKRHTEYLLQRLYVFRGEREGNTFVICPDEALPVKRIEHNPDKLQAAYDEGRRIALRELDRIKGFVNT